MNVVRSKKFQMAVVLLLCAAILTGGSFAWFSLNQNVLNEFSWNPEGANLHDDFTDPNKDVYVENTGTLPLLVRVQLKEFMQYGRSPVTTIPTDATQADKTSWPAHSGGATAADCGNGFHDYWIWTMGGEKWYVPADQAKIDAIRGFGNDGGKDTEYNEKDPVVNSPVNEDGLPKALKDKYASYEALAQAITNDTVMQGHLTTLNEKKAALTNAIEAYSQAPTDTAKAEELKSARDAHYAAQTVANKYALETFGVQHSRPAQIKLMSEWVNEGKALGDFWVIDTNGWCYWANPLEAGEATGLLLDKVEATEKINELKQKRQPYYYGIDVTMQAATADDVEKYWNETYAGTGQTATTDAQELLNKIAAVCTSSEGSVGTADAAALFALLEQEDANTYRGVHWYLDPADGTWRYTDGRWIYDGQAWLLDGRTYPFATDVQLIDWDAGDAYYIDDYWCYVAGAWRPAAGNPGAFHPDDVTHGPQEPSTDSGGQVQNPDNMGGVENPEPDTGTPDGGTTDSDVTDTGMVEETPEPEETASEFETP